MKITRCSHAQIKPPVRQNWHGDIRLLARVINGVTLYLIITEGGSPRSKAIQSLFSNKLSVFPPSYFVNSLAAANKANLAITP